MDSGYGDGGYDVGGSYRVNYFRYSDNEGDCSGYDSDDNGRDVAVL